MVLMMRGRSCTAAAAAPAAAVRKEGNWAHARSSAAASFVLAEQLTFATRHDYDSTIA